MLSKGVYLLLGLFIVLIIIPVILIKGDFWREDINSQLIRVYNHKEKKIVIMELEEYLRGVVAAEMPALYHPEALKAQAVAARTYTLRQLPEYGGAGCRNHPGADISTDFNTSQAWLSEEEMRERWGFLPFFYYWTRVNNAVEETEGEVLQYKFVMIDAVYHANAGGITENSRHVWGREKPYLLSVESPYDSIRQKNYINNYYFGLVDIMEKLELNSKDESGSEGNVGLDENLQLEVLKRSESGRVLELKMGSHVFTGNEFRQRLSLPSNMFTITREGDIFTFTVKGKGHGAGMSQDGADGFARHGYNYKEILAHYYPGTTITEIEPLK